MLKRIETKLIRIFESILYFALVCTFKFIMSIFLVKINVEGKENIPKKGRFILAANHQNFFDGFFLGCVTGTAKKVSFVIARRAVKFKLFRLFLKMTGSVIIGNEPEEYQRALKKLNRILTHGGIVGIFPEGNVFNHALPRKFKGGVAKLSLDSKTRVIPIYLNGTYDLRSIKYLLKRPTITIRVGKPVDLYNSVNLYKNNLEELAMVIREKIIELMGIQEYDNLTTLDSKNISVNELLHEEKKLPEKISKISAVR